MKLFFKKLDKKHEAELKIKLLNLKSEGEQKTQVLFEDETSSSWNDQGMQFSQDRNY